MGSGKWMQHVCWIFKGNPTTHPLPLLSIHSSPNHPSTHLSINGCQLPTCHHFTTIHPSIHPSTSTSKNVKCQVMYKRQVILTGHKDPASNLWTLPIFPKEWSAKVDKYNSQNQIWASAKCGGTKYQKWKSSIAECESFGARSHSYVEHIVIPT